jgi:hypothetical protein
MTFESICKLIMFGEQDYCLMSTELLNAKLNITNLIDNELLNTNLIDNELDYTNLIDNGLNET